MWRIRQISVTNIKNSDDVDTESILGPTLELKRMFFSSRHCVPIPPFPASKKPL
jgi:hypothetical protein